MNPYNIVPLVNEHCATGENPFWNPHDGCVYWTDIPNGKLFRYDPASQTHRTIYEGEQVGGFTLQADGNWLLFRVDDIATLAPDGKVRSLLPFHDEGAERFNDVIADPAGRVFAGTIGVTKQSGGLYRIDLDGTITKLFDGTGNGNGMGFTPDEQHFYWTDSTNKTIFRFRYDRRSGELSDRTVFHQGAPDEGTPDGLAVDKTGQVWSARHRAGAIFRFRPDGTLAENIAFPVARPTSLFFGGTDLDIAYITTAGGEAGANSDDGTLYQMTTDVRGQNEFSSRILVG